MAAKRTLSEDLSEGLKKVKEDPEGSWVCSFCQNVNWPKRTHCNKEGCHMPREAAGGQHPEGSWACVQCNNVNWPKRTQCNKCQVPRGGSKLAGAGMVSTVGAAPGSWICPLCANLNWPARTVCNKGCGTPKPAPVGLGQLSQIAGLNLEPYLKSLLASATSPFMGGAQG